MAEDNKTTIIAIIAIAAFVIIVYIVELIKSFFAWLGRVFTAIGNFFGNIFSAIGNFFGTHWLAMLLVVITAGLGYLSWLYRNEIMDLFRSKEEKERRRIKREKQAELERIEEEKREKAETRKETRLLKEKTKQLAIEREIKLAEAEKAKALKQAKETEITNKEYHEFVTKKKEVKTDFDRVWREVNKWVPKKSWPKEDGYQADLAAFLESGGLFEQVDVLEEKTGKPDILVNNKIPIELKRNIKSTAYYDHLERQIRNYVEAYGDVIVIVVALSNLQKWEQFKSRYATNKHIRWLVK